MVRSRGVALASRLALAGKALRQLGPGQVAQFAWYQALLRSGYLRWATHGPDLKTGVRPGRSPSFVLRPLLALPDREVLRQILGEGGVTSLLAEADEILSGKVRLFGSEAVSLVLSVPEPLSHWTEYELKDNQGALGDIKLVWEPGRFGWAYTLARAYTLTGDERYAQNFWEYTQAFLESNPPYLGPHWVSAQEVAFRLIALTFCAPVFAASPHSTVERLALLSRAVGFHAERIPPSLAYARAQNNNHLLGEAAGLYTAGLALPEHPQATRWRELGWRWLHWGLQRQIDEDGAYVQHSSNYHRLMLQIALWVAAIARGENRPFPERTCQRLGMATRWLLALVDPLSGRVPNLGPNDGAYLQPLAICPFHDYRPVLQAAASAFLDERPFSPGPWDELPLWLGHPERWAIGNRAPNSLTPNFFTPHVLRMAHHNSWAYLRAARFHSRPGHADQLHLDLWWRGVNLAQDAGSYSYNDLPPWDNSLARTSAHNTLAVNGQDQMTRAGRFLWLDWAQAEVIAHDKADDGAWERLVARHDGYRSLGLLHQRSVTAFHDGRWLVEDSLLKVGKLKVKSPDRSSPTFNLYWLLPDWEWEILENGETSVKIRLRSPWDWVVVEIQATDGAKLAGVQLVRAGEVMYGLGDAPPFLGWVSPTYAHRLPALSFNVAVAGTPPFSLTTIWHLPTNQDGQRP